MSMIESTRRSATILGCARMLRNVVTGVLPLASILLAMLAIVGYLRFGSVRVAMAALRGEMVTVEEPVLTLDRVLPGSRVSLPYVVANHSSNPIKLIGMTSSCTCTTLSQLPITVPPRGTSRITATVKTLAGHDEAAGSDRIYTDDPSAVELVVGYRLRFTPPPPQEDPAGVK